MKPSHFILALLLMTAILPRPQAATRPNIFIAISGDSDDQSIEIARAEEVVAKLNEGGDFVKLAAQYSDDASTKDNGGNLGRVSDGLPLTLVEEVLKLKAGEFSQQPIVLQNGIHIVKRLNEVIMPLEQVSGWIFQELVYLEHKRLYEEKLETITSEAKVVNNLTQ